MKGLPICFSEVQVKNDVTDNNNKHFVTAFEGECRNIIELREHLKLCFLIILVPTATHLMMVRHSKCALLIADHTINPLACYDYNLKYQIYSWNRKIRKQKS